MDDQPILTFDTSAINDLANDASSDALIEQLRTRFHVRLTFTSISEIIATQDSEGRHKLAGICRRLLSCGDCIEPQYVLLKKMISALEEECSFDWQSVDVRFHEAIEGLSTEENLTDEVSDQARKENKGIKEKFESSYANMKPIYVKLFAEGHVPRPTTFSESTGRLKMRSTFLAMAKALYEAGAKKPATDAIVQKFIDACPPFHTLMVALCAKLYDHCMRAPKNPSLETGAADTFMAVCLPYCHQFVSADCSQLRCFKEVVDFLGLNVDVKSYQEFQAPFS